MKSRASAARGCSNKSLHMDVETLQLCVSDRFIHETLTYLLIHVDRIIPRKPQLNRASTLPESHR